MAGATRSISIAGECVGGPDNGVVERPVCTVRKKCVRSRVGRLGLSQFVIFKHLLMLVDYSK